MEGADISECSHVSVNQSVNQTINQLISHSVRPFIHPSTRCLSI